MRRRHKGEDAARVAEGSFPYWVALRAEACTGTKYHLHRSFCAENGLCLSIHGHSVIFQNEWYEVFRFSERDHAERFIARFGGEPMDPRDKGRGNDWMHWYKGKAAKKKPKYKPYDFSKRD